MSRNWSAKIVIDLSPSAIGVLEAVSLAMSSRSPDRPAPFSAARSEYVPRVGVILIGRFGRHVAVVPSLLPGVCQLRRRRRCRALSPSVVVGSLLSPSMSPCRWLPSHLCGFCLAELFSNRLFIAHTSMGAKLSTTAEAACQRLACD